VHAVVGDEEFGITGRIGVFCYDSSIPFAFFIALRKVEDIHTDKESAVRELTCQKSNLVCNTDARLLRIEVGLHIAIPF